MLNKTFFNVKEIAIIKRGLYFNGKTLKKNEIIYIYIYIYIYIKTILKIIFYKNQQQLKE
jgi:hypothetical protein